ncbi:MAG: L-serine ammonia-lyase [Chitinophagales bacterium]
MEFVSVFDIFKIGIGPSSSHTMGPWRAAQKAIQKFLSKNSLENLSKIEVHFFGSLAKTGKGHGSQMAVQLGLMQEDPVEIDPATIADKLSQIKNDKALQIQGKSIAFDPETNIHFHSDEKLPEHPNGMRFNFIGNRKKLIFSAEYYSVGGGFVEEPGFDARDKNAETTNNSPYPNLNADDLLRISTKEEQPLSWIVWQNEKAFRSEEAVKQSLLKIWRCMRNSIHKGCHSEGVLPGYLKVKRRAFKLNQQLISSKNYSGVNEWMSIIRKSNPNFQQILKWVSCFALAVNEENAAFGKIVTAPTNGAAGVIPAVLMFHMCFNPHKGEEDVVRFLLTAGEIGSVFKKGSTISAAMGGCQAEIGVSSAMAAAGLTECLGGSAEQALMAAEIAMEHHLGMTCDPVGGFVQIPCIERNSMGAIKAIMAAHIALESDPADAKISLNTIVKTMWETAKDMNENYKETSDGGLAKNYPVNLIEC